MTFVTRKIILSKYLFNVLFSNTVISILNVVMMSPTISMKMASGCLGNGKTFIPFEIMPVTSKTGLLPTAKKDSSKRIKETSTVIEMPNLVVPAPFMLRPFAGIYNPFPYACSILCNHPTDCEAKAIVQKAKDTWAAEGKSLLDVEEQEVFKKQSASSHQYAPYSEEAETIVPQDLFLRYGDPGSIPLTPAPTIVSAATKIYPNLKARRCLTPDPTSLIPAKEKTLLVLDLRRSHSQETVCWQREQFPDYEIDAIQDEIFSRELSPPCQNVSQSKKRRSSRKKSTTSSGTASSLKTQNSKDSDNKVQGQNSVCSTSPSRSSLVQEHDKEHGKSSRSSPGTSSEERIIKRRGKRRKGKKSGKNSGLREGDKEFKGIPDPGETQVSALGSESQGGSSRPSISSAESASKVEENVAFNKNVTKNVFVEEREKSFLDSDILRQLQRQLDQEVVDAEMNIKRKKALEEALRHKMLSKKGSSKLGEEMKVLKEAFEMAIRNSEAWLTIPRVFTRRSARFELPMDSRLLNELTPFSYVQNYVFPSPARLVLYNHIFNLYKEEPEDDTEAERIISGKNVLDGLGKIMGRELTAAEAENFQNLIGWTDDTDLNFRTFIGIGAACERLLGPSFVSKMPDQTEDPRHEVEIADFETLEGKLNRLKPSEKLAKVLRSIRDL